jgi:hypothetical protein
MNQQYELKVAEKTIQLHLDFPLNYLVNFKVEKDQGESFGIKKLQNKVIAFLEQSFAI